MSYKWLKSNKIDFYRTKFHDLEAMDEKCGERSDYVRNQPCGGVITSVNFNSCQETQYNCTCDALHG
jgi:hypothetical protein